MFLTLCSTSSNLGTIPAAPLPAYCASKAALDSFILALREKMRNTSVKVIELSPPAVQSMFEYQEHVAEQR